ncbi:FHA domain-containing protein [Propionicimonas paludicola]|uniref:FHA domain-containing protein n=1 Tax=Propionicimonas paludicola TaxID=185243 RepID=A0A2A9CR57_9ACTN|nr:FHA domain-containing protein [Propionicimonas paludicola]PFG16893.1 FHA domain-containing protein [Propionicimonas paludicola]
MATCPAGHPSNQADFCDVCGLPIGGEPVAVATDAADQPAETLSCPNCSTANVADALFCENCGYDFTTGTLPASPDAEVVTPPAPAEAETDQAAAPSPSEADAAAPSPSEAEPTPAAPVAEASTPVSATPSPTTAPTVLKRPPVEWIAELWIDPDWYAAQGSTDPLPSPGLPDIVPLIKPSSLIGRVSHSRGIFPDVDCELDTGCSRRHAMLTTDGTRWWVEDLNSANGTFVGAAAGPLPAMPIPQGRVELAAGQRIYLGAWTRIVIRKATPDEQEAFAG